MDSWPAPSLTTGGAPFARRGAAAAAKVVAHSVWRHRCAVVDAASELVIEIHNSGFISIESARAQQLHQALDAVTRNRNRSAERLFVPNRLWSSVSAVVGSSRAVIAQLVVQRGLFQNEAVVERLERVLALVDFDGPRPRPIDEATSFADGLASRSATEDQPGRLPHNNPPEARAC